MDADIAALIATGGSGHFRHSVQRPHRRRPRGLHQRRIRAEPGQTARKNSQMDLVVAGTEAAVLMVESEAQQLSEEIMLGAVVFGHEQCNVPSTPSTNWCATPASPCGTGKRPAKTKP